jgi:hypothetical protein
MPAIRVITREGEAELEAVGLPSPGFAGKADIHGCSTIVAIPIVSVGDRVLAFLAAQLDEFASIPNVCLPKGPSATPFLDASGCASRRLAAIL